MTQGGDSDMRFDFATATKIVFGPGSLNELGTLVAPLGQHALVVTGRQPERAEAALAVLKAQQIQTTVFPTEGEPKIETAEEGSALARKNQCDLVIGFGGGSALDAGKAIAALMTNPGDPLDYLEVIGAGKPIRVAAAPFVAIPTTAGTGSEVTSNAVLASEKHRVKVSLRSPLMLARIALVDSVLTHTSPPDVTAQSGLDALTQVIEPFVSNKANPLTDAICREGIRLGARSLGRAYENGEDATAREEMALVSLFGGIALSNAKLGAVHGFAGPFGGMFDAPHGGICARLLPYVMEANIRALREREPESHYLSRYTEIARIVTGAERARAEDGAAWVHELVSRLQVPGLGVYGLKESDYGTVVEKAAVASSMQGNPVKLTADELIDILRKAA